MVRCLCSRTQSAFTSSRTHRPRTCWIQYSQAGRQHLAWEPGGLGSRSQFAANEMRYLEEIMGPIKAPVSSTLKWGIALVTLQGTFQH